MYSSELNIQVSCYRVAILAIALVAALPVQAERFATIAEAQKLMFPTATEMESRLFRYSTADARAIEKLAGTKLRKPVNRLWIAREGTNLLGVVLHDQVLGKHEVIDYAVGITPSGQVKSIEVLEYRESYGGEIRGAKWRSQFRGKTADAPLTLHRDVYNLSGATISCRNVTEGVKRMLAVFETVVRPQLFAGDRVPVNSPSRQSR